jgi:hypothetical protein
VWGRAADADEAGTGAAESAGDPHATPLQKDVARVAFLSGSPGFFFFFLLKQWLAGFVLASQGWFRYQSGAPTLRSKYCATL